MKYLLSFALLFLFYGCSATSQFPQKIQTDNIIAIVEYSGQKTTYIKKHGSLERYCASRASDAVSSDATSFSLGLSTAAQGESIGESSGAGALSFGGRDPMVLITREVLYRACEMSMNLNLDKNDTIDTYKMFLKFIENISKNDKNEGVKALGEETQSTLEEPAKDSDDD